jgi:hypothetical protein
MAAVRCAALGCFTTKLNKSGLFCKKHWDLLSEDMRAPTPRALKAAIAHLGKLEGYLVDATPPRARIQDARGPGSEYV